mgnify:FL=1
MLSNIVRERILGLVGFINTSKIKDIEKSWEDYFEQFHIIDDQEQLKEFNNTMEQRIMNFKFKEEKKVKDI